MRWIKHMVATRRDEKVAKLIVTAGHVGYAVWWMILETVAERIEKGDESASVTYPVSQWSVALSLRGSHVRHHLEKIALTHPLTVEWNGDDITVTIPNLLKYKDEYSTRVGTNSRQYPEQKQIQKQNNTPKAPSSPLPRRRPASVFSTPDQANRFEEFWDSYWRKVGKAAAQKSYAKAIPTPELHGRVMAAITAQAPTMLARDPENRPHASTWLNGSRWEDEVQAGEYRPKSRIELLMEQA